MKLHIIAPAFDPVTVAGAGVALVELTSRFLRQLPATRIYLNARTAGAFPEWREASVIVPTGCMANSWRKAAAVARLQAFSFPNFPQDGVCWFPFGPMMPFWFRGNGISTIHDTLELDLPALVSPLERAFRKILMPATVRHAQVVTVSQFSRARLQHHYGIDATVIRLATPALPPPSTAKIPSSPYVFYPANGYAHKNHQFLLGLWRRRLELKSLALVFTLGSGLASLERSIRAARDAGAKVFVTGRVTGAELAGLYANAVCTALPTLYEGFGLPLQEALICDCPAIVNQACPAFSENVTPDYPHFLPIDPDLWTHAILSLINSPREHLHSYLITRTWDDCARDYIATFDSFGRAGAIA
ncbi:MAG: glycosyltransferase [Verrucomicrobiota bacterium]